MLDWTLYGRLSMVLIAQILSRKSYRANLIAQIKSHKVRSGIAAQTQNL